MQCVACHRGAEKSERAGFPPVSFCRGCHEVKGPVPARRVYRVPDFVFFSHARHKMECRNCHDMTKPAVAPRMKDCVACHKARGATVECEACHELSR